MNRSATASSSAGSLGEWMRLQPHGRRPSPSAPIELVDRGLDALAAEPRRAEEAEEAGAAIAMTSRVVAMPLAISPAT